MKELERAGLKVLTTFDPAVQAAAERALSVGIAALGANAKELDGAVVVTSPHTGEVNAIVGGRSGDGFNRALDARRPIGSLIKPAIYLTALESGRYTLASVIDDSPIDVKLDNGDVWSPHDYDGEPRGEVPLIRALAESLNLATVRLGLDVGLEPIAKNLGRLGLAQKPKLYPSMLLGALALTPLEVAQIYNTLANGGFRVPLRAVRDVLGEDGRALQRYSMQIEQAADPAAVYALNQALVQVMERGTGRTARAQLPAGLTVAGKTGTSDDLRDSWFAGFTNDHLTVAWLGADDNRPSGLTGATGARRSGRASGGSKPTRTTRPRPIRSRAAWIDYLTGEPRPRAATTPSQLPLPAPMRGRALVRLRRRTGFGARHPPLAATRRHGMNASGSAPRSRAAASWPAPPGPATRRARRSCSRRSSWAAREAARTLTARARRLPAGRRPGSAGRGASDSAPSRAAAAERRARREQALLEQSRAERAAGNYDAGHATSIERALRIDPNNAALWLELGELELATGDAQPRAWRARR